MFTLKNMKEGENMSRTSDSNRVKSEQSFTQIRLSSELFRKSKILAAIYDVSFSQLMVNALNHEIQKYESEHGSLPKSIELEE